MAGKPIAGSPSSCEEYWAKARLRLFGFIAMQPSGCWQWMGSYFTGKPYGQFSAGGRNWRAHRFSYEALRGPIHDGLTLDHLCRNPGCVNPMHLEPVTDVVNILRGEGIHARNARKTHCDKGHEFTPENTGATASGGRYCKECGRLSVAEKRKNRTPAQIERDRERMAEYDAKRRDKASRAAQAKARWDALPEHEKERRRRRMNEYDERRRQASRE